IYVTTQDTGDNSFDAGGNVSVGLTAATLVSQWTWAATLLQSSSVASKYGISGPFWYASGATIQLLLLKIRAPGAKTFLQVIWARFDKKTHVTFCVFALATNIIVTSMLMLGGTAVLTNLIKDFSVEYATCLVCAVIGSYTFIGGLGATFYMSYCATSIMFVILLICIMQVYHVETPGNPLGSVAKVYQYVDCLKGPVGNEDRSYLTLISIDGLMFGIINIIGNFGTVFVDQSFWQSSVAAKPKTGALGFLSGGLVWFAIPFCFATAMGLGYISLSFMQGQPILSDADIDKGLVPPAVAQRLLGLPGELMIVVMLIMAVISTGSSEIIAVVSILIYDVYAVHLKVRPYRAALDSNSCILCGKAKGRMANPRDKCSCESMTFCLECKQDNEAIANNKRALKPAYKCKTHGAYRSYKDYLSAMKDWCIVWTTLAIIPMTFVLNFMQISLGWLYLFMGVLIGSAVAPICLSMCWARLTGKAMVAGSVSGTVLGLVAWLTTAAFMEGGLGQFMKSTGSNEAMLAGNLVSMGLGLIVTVVVTMVTNRDFQPEKAAEVWETTRDIDNPLHPWSELYAK
uniref:Urea active transporter n=1 Tax=Macrostomum lignano TaxID=282301 RepID=A0A1I8I9R1_9PLAT